MLIQREPAIALKMRSQVAASGKHRGVDLESIVVTSGKERIVSTGNSINKWDWEKITHCNGTGEKPRRKSNLQARRAPELAREKRVRWEIVELQRKAGKGHRKQALLMESETLLQNEKKKLFECLS